MVGLVAILLLATFATASPLWLKRPFHRGAGNRASVALWPLLAVGMGLLVRGFDESAQAWFSVSVTLCALSVFALAWHTKRRRWIYGAFAHALVVMGLVLVLPYPVSVATGFFTSLGMCWALHVTAPSRPLGCSSFLLALPAAHLCAMAIGLDVGQLIRQAGWAAFVNPGAASWVVTLVLVALVGAGAAAQTRRLYDISVPAAA